ncbi:MAG: BolA family transcriptional regulator [Rhodocyclaceae bacterium]|nr:MAG: BolA family transcriptional regulator [Rhodocyclaceae bacterium]
MNVPDEIRQRLAVLQPSRLEIVDQSALHAGHEGAKGGGGHYQMTIVSPMFSGQGTIKRHRLVYDALGALMEREIHAMSMTTLSPEDN